jgi:transcription initiation factor TFIIIB Brf1 subunit/transcription initiation factor TFIIB
MRCRRRWKTREGGFSRSLVSLTFLLYVCSLHNQLIPPCCGTPYNANAMQHFVDAGHRLYMLALTHNFTHGRKMQHVLAACLYIVCRRERSSHLLIDFAEKLRENVFLLGATYLKFVKLLSLQLPVIDPSLYIHRFAANMDLGEDAQQVANTALRIVARMKRDWIHTGRRPAGICGASILIAARVHGYRRTRAEVQHVVRVTEATIRNRLAEFQNTPSSLLTPDEFDTLEFSTECDPPAYIRGLLEEELAKEQAMLEAAVADDEKPYALTDAAATSELDASLTLVEKPSVSSICPSLPPPTEHVDSQRRAETLVTDEMLQKLMSNPRIRAVVDNTLLISERDLGPHLSRLASSEVLAEQHRQNRPAEAAEAAAFVSDAGSFPTLDQQDQMTLGAESAGAPEHGTGTSAADALRAAASRVGLADISKTDMRLWKVRALLQRDWGRGRESFVKLKEKREGILSKLSELQQNGNDMLESVSEADASEIAGNLHMLSAMVEEHDNDDGQSGVDPSDMPYSAHEENIRAAFSTASAPAQAKVAPASLEKRDRNAFSNACDADPTEQANRPSKKRRTGAGDDTGSVSGEPIVLHLAVGAAAHKSKSQDKLDNLYVTLATKFHEELPAAGSEHASTVNRLLFDRSNLSASQSVHRVLQRQEISASLVGLANKDYEEVRARAHSWELPYRDARHTRILAG